MFILLLICFQLISSDVITPHVRESKVPSLKDLAMMACCKNAYNDPFFFTQNTINCLQVIFDNGIERFNKNLFNQVKKDNFLKILSRGLGQGSPMNSFRNFISDGNVSVWSKDLLDNPTLIDHRFNSFRKLTYPNITIKPTIYAEDEAACYFRGETNKKFFLIKMSKDDNALSSKRINGIACCTISDFNPVLYKGYHDRVYAYDKETLQCVTSFLLPDLAWCEQIIELKCGQLLFVRSDINGCFLINTITKQVDKVFKHVACLAFSSSKSRLVCCHESLCKIYDVKVNPTWSIQLLHEHLFDEPCYPISNVFFIPNKDDLFGIYHGHISLYDTRYKATLMTVDFQGSIAGKLHFPLKDQTLAFIKSSGKSSVIPISIFCGFQYIKQAIQKFNARNKSEIICPLRISLQTATKSPFSYQLTNFPQEACYDFSWKALMRGGFNW